METDLDCLTSFFKDEILMVASEKQAGEVVLSTDDTFSQFSLQLSNTIKNAPHKV